MTRLHAQAAAGLVFVLLAIGVALFGAAGTLGDWRGWAFLAVFGASSAAITVDLALRDPALLARRVQAGPLAEPSPRQKVIQALASLGFLGLFVACGLDQRYGCSHLPAWLSALGDALVALGMYIVFRVYRANTFTAATIAVEPDQRVIDTGPYARVRHPMYAGALVMLLGIPPALGSWWGLAAFPAMLAVIAWRLTDEERQLSTHLRGYTDYRARVRYRLLPRVW